MMTRGEVRSRCLTRLNDVWWTTGFCIFDRFPRRRAKNFGNKLVQKLVFNLINKANFQMPCTDVTQNGIMKCKLEFNCNFMLGCLSFPYRRGRFLRVFLMDARMKVIFTCISWRHRP